MVIAEELGRASLAIDVQESDVGGLQIQRREGVDFHCVFLSFARRLLLLCCVDVAGPCIQRGLSDSAVEIYRFLIFADGPRNDFNIGVASILPQVLQHRRVGLHAHVGCEANSGEGGCDARGAAVATEVRWTGNLLFIGHLIWLLIR